ncbi:MAG: hypothetical protein ACPGUV_04260 [Polyangiales bacterium]
MGLSAGLWALPLIWPATISTGHAAGKARVYVVQKRIPRTLSERKLLRFAKTNRAKVLQEKKDKPIDERQWRAEMVLSFKRPPFGRRGGAQEFTVLFYDLERRQEFIQDLVVMVPDPSQKTFVQKIRLKRPNFQPNHRIRMVVTLNRREVAEVELTLRGEQKKRSGVVDFNE